MKTFADLKRKLSKGQAVKLINWNGQTEQNITKENAGTSRLGKVRFVVKTQTNGVYFSPDKEAKTGSNWEFPNASLVEVSETGFKVFGIGKRELTEKEKQVIAGEPRDEEQSRVDAMTDGSVMYYKNMRYYKELGYNYLRGMDWEKGMKLDYNDQKVFDKSIKGSLELEYEFVNN